MRNRKTVDKICTGKTAWGRQTKTIKTQPGLAQRLLVLGSISKEREKRDILDTCLDLTQVQANLGAQQLEH